MEKKLVNLWEKKFMINFQQKPSAASSEASTPPEIKGKEIGKMLAASSPPARPVAPEKKATERKFQKINNVYADLL